MKAITSLLGASIIVMATTAIALAAPTTAGPSPAAASSQQTSSTQCSTTHRVDVRRARMPQKQVKAVQAALNSNGEQVAVDGIWGPKTRAALKDFQQKHGIAATGHANAATLQQLKITM